MGSSVRPVIRRTDKRLAVAASTLGALASIGTGVAFADGGGIGAPRPPEVRDVICEDRCAGLREAAPGARVELSGRNLEYVSEVRFAARGGGRIATEPRGITSSTIDAVVPDDAATGTVQVSDASGQTAESEARLGIVGADELEAGSGARIAKVSAVPQKGFFAGKRQATASFVPQGGGAQHVRVDVVDHKSGGLVRSIVAKDLPAGAPARVRWNGKTDSGKVAPNGRYDFDVRPMAGGPVAEASFEQYDHIFPIRGKHDFGDGLGAGRGHQGTDAFASCGTRLVAARGGKVQTRAYHDRAGNYLVIDGKKTDVDYAYMHMIEPAEVKEGERVKTGETIGRVGETGNASGCHLHFEMWEGGWYEGGTPADSRAAMKRWDGWS